MVRRLTKSGPGTLALTGANTYSGEHDLEQGGGTIDLGGSGTLLDNPSSITIDDQGTFKLDNSAAYVSTRISPLATITLAGGTLDFVGDGQHGRQRIDRRRHALGRPHVHDRIRPRLGRHGHAHTGFAVHGQRRQRQLSSAPAVRCLPPARNQIDIALSPGSLTNGILPYATVTGPASLDLATYMSNSSGVAITALPAADYVTSLAAAGPTSNVKLSSPGSYTANGATINALLVSGSGINVGAANDSLTVSSGAGRVCRRRHQHAFGRTPEPRLAGFHHGRRRLDRPRSAASSPAPVQLR